MHYLHVTQFLGSRCRKPTWRVLSKSTSAPAAMSLPNVCIVPLGIAQPIQFSNAWTNNKMGHYQNMCNIIVMWRERKERKQTDPCLNNNNHLHSDPCLNNNNHAHLHSPLCLSYWHRNVGWDSPQRVGELSRCKQQSWGLSYPKTITLFRNI